MSELERILQEEALAEVNEILASADSRAERIIREAKNRASEQVEICRKKAEAELRAARGRAKSAGELAVSMARIRAKGEAIALVKGKALAAFEEIVSKPNYKQILEALAEDANRAVEEAEAVVVHPDDRSKLSSWAMQKELELRTDSELHFGVRIMARKGQCSVENTLPERVQRAWETLASGVTARLWGEPE